MPVAKRKSDVLKGAFANCRVDEDGQLTIVINRHGQPDLEVTLVFDKQDQFDGLWECIATASELLSEKRKADKGPDDDDEDDAEDDDDLDQDESGSRDSS
jgi:hypothetical protein